MKEHFKRAIDWIIENNSIAIVLILLFIDISLKIIRHYSIKINENVPDLSEPICAFLVSSLILSIIKLNRSIEKEYARRNQERENAPPLFYCDPELEGKIIRCANSELLFIQETGQYILDRFRDDIDNFMRKGNMIKFIVTAPNDLIHTCLALRNSTQSATNIRERTTTPFREFQRLKSSVENNPHNFSVRFLPYPTEMTQIISDPAEDDSHACIRYASFNTPFSEKLCSHIEKKQNKKLFEHYQKQFQIMYFRSIKKILITGDSKIGKTSLLLDLVQRIKDAQYLNNVFYFITPEKTNIDGARIGFDCISSDSTLNKRHFMRKVKDEYCIADENLIPDLCKKINEFINSTSYLKIVLLDEIGPMQLQFNDFKECIDTLFNDPTITVFASCATDDKCTNIPDKQFLNRIKAHFLTDIYELDKNTRDLIRREILTEFSESLQGQEKIL